jgi:hypothetical protein
VITFCPIPLLFYLQQNNIKLIRVEYIRLFKPEITEFKRMGGRYSIVAILELIRGAQCLIEVIRSSGEEMYYSRGIEEAKRTHPRFADWVK